MRSAGWSGVKPDPLVALLREAPSAAVIDALSVVADEECLVILGRIARTKPDLTDAALAALESIGSSRAASIAAASRHPLASHRVPASRAICICELRVREPIDLDRQ